MFRCTSELGGSNPSARLIVMSPYVIIRDWKVPRFRGRRNSATSYSAASSSGKLDLVLPCQILANRESLSSPTTP